MKTVFYSHSSGPGTGPISVPADIADFVLDDLVGHLKDGGVHADRQGHSIVYPEQEAQAAGEALNHDGWIYELGEKRPGGFVIRRKDMGQMGIMRIKVWPTRLTVESTEPRITNTKVPVGNT